MSDEQNQHDNQDEKGPDLDAVSGAETLILPREPEADVKPDEGQGEETKADATTPGSVLAEQNPDFVPPNENPEFVARHSKRTAS